MAAAVGKDERADEDAALALAHDLVPHRRGVAGAVDDVPRARYPGVLGGVDACLDQLPAGRDLTRPGVDEEDGHEAQGYAPAQPRLAGAPAALRRRPAPAWHGRE